MGRAHSNRGYSLRFKDFNDMSRFILLYQDLFVPYSDDKKRCRSYVQDTPTYKTKAGNLYSKGHHDENIIKMLDAGYDWSKRNDIYWLKVNMYPEDFKSIPKDDFVKTRFRPRGVIVYDYVG